MSRLLNDSPSPKGLQDTGFSPGCYLRYDIKPHFWPSRFAPVFARFLSQDTMGVYPVTLSLLARLSLFGVDLGWGASCDDRTRANAKATKTRDTWGKKERLASGCWRAFLSLSRVVTPAPVEAGGGAPKEKS